jgi:methionyl-tRNA formyltransferase
VRLGVAATPEVAIPTLNWLLESEHELALIITQPDKPAGRGRNLRQSPVADWADQHKVAIVKPEATEDLKVHLFNIDCVVTIGYGVLLPQSVLDIPQFGFLNLHFSLLPAYRGAAPVQRALQNGDSISGVSVFQLEKGMDTGPIYSTISIQIEPQWRSTELLSVLSKLGPSAVEKALQMIERGESPTPQTGDTTIAPKISKLEAQIDFRKDSTTIVNHIRAFTYEPGAWCLWKGESFKITEAISVKDVKLAEGVIGVDAKRVLVGCAADSAIELLKVTPSGKKEMSAIEWARGARLTGGEHFG